MLSPNVSIVTVAYNAARTIEATLDSVAAQTYPHIEHIVIDGGSTDGTVGILRRRNGLARWSSEPDSGVYDAMNKGLRVAGGEVIGFLNADDIFASSGAVDRVMREFRHPATEACYGDLVYVDAEDTDRVVRYWRTGSYRPGTFGHGWVPPHPTFYARRATYERLGAFDLKYRFSADFDLMLRFVEKARVPTIYIPEVLVRMRVGGLTNSSIRNILRGNLEILHSCRVHSAQVNLWRFVLSKLAIRGRQYLSRERRGN